MKDRKQTRRIAKHNEKTSKRIIPGTVALCLALACLLMAAVTVLTCTVSAAPDFEVTVPYGTPTVDGVIDEDEYSLTLVMDKDSAAAWVGKVGKSCVVWHLSWDENGLYYAGTVNDSTQTYRDDNNHWVGIDCLELAVNPGESIKGESDEGIFFSFGATEDGRVIAYRHNYSDGLVTDEITGVSSGHVKGSDSYTIEVFIPWSLMKLKTTGNYSGGKQTKLNTKSFKAEAGAVLGILPCAIDAKEGYTQDSGILAAYKFNGTDFLVKDFIRATLGEKPAEQTETDTEPETELETGLETDAGTGTDTESPDGTDETASYEIPSDTDGYKDATDAPGTAAGETGETGPSDKTDGGCASVCLSALTVIAGLAIGLTTAVAPSNKQKVE